MIANEGENVMVSFFSVLTVLAGSLNANFTFAPGHSVDTSDWQDGDFFDDESYLQWYFSLKKASLSTIGVAAVSFSVRSAALGEIDSLPLDCYVTWGNKDSPTFLAYSGAGFHDPRNTSTLDVEVGAWYDFNVTPFYGNDPGETMPPVGDTLYWTVSLLSFTSANVDLASWSLADPHWELADTTTVHFVTVTGPYERGSLKEGLARPPAALPVLRLDLTGRPLDSDARGLVLERGPDGLWRRQVVLE